MIKKLQTFQITCDVCGYDNEFSQFLGRKEKVVLPDEWKVCNLHSERGTRMEGETNHHLCPYCMKSEKTKEKYYARD